MAVAYRAFFSHRTLPMLSQYPLSRNGRQCIKSQLDRGIPRSPRRLSRRLHGVTRRHASSAEYRLLALRRVPPRIRRTEPSRVAQLATRHAVPLPHYMLNPFKRSQQPLIGSPQAGNSAANKTRKQAFYNGSVGSVPRLFHLSFCLYQSFTATPLFVGTYSLGTCGSRQ